VAGFSRLNRRKLLVNTELEGNGKEADLGLIAELSTFSCVFVRHFG
jgi:hypothetical protein